MQCRPKMRLLGRQVFQAYTHSLCRSGTDRAPWDTLISSVPSLLASTLSLPSDNCFLPRAECLGFGCSLVCVCVWGGLFQLREGKLEEGGLSSRSFHRFMESFCGVTSWSFCPDLVSTLLSSIPPADLGDASGSLWSLSHLFRNPYLWSAREWSVSDIFCLAIGCSFLSCH